MVGSLGVVLSISGKPCRCKHVTTGIVIAIRSECTEDLILAGASKPGLNLWTHERSEICVHVHCQQNDLKSKTTRTNSMQRSEATCFRQKIKNFRHQISFPIYDGKRIPECLWPQASTAYAASVKFTSAIFTHELRHNIEATARSL